MQARGSGGSQVFKVNRGDQSPSTECRGRGLWKIGCQLGGS